MFCQWFGVVRFAIVRSCCSRLITLGILKTLNTATFVNSTSFVCTYCLESSCICVSCIYSEHYGRGKCFVAAYQMKTEKMEPIFCKRMVQIVCYKWLPYVLHTMECNFFDFDLCTLCLCHFARFVCRYPINVFKPKQSDEKSINTNLQTYLNKVQIVRH